MSRGVVTQFPTYQSSIAGPIRPSLHQKLEMNIKTDPWTVVIEFKTTDPTCRAMMGSRRSPSRVAVPFGADPETTVLAKARVWLCEGALVGQGIESDRMGIALGTEA